jgi:hypothetical protein
MRRSTHVAETKRLRIALFGAFGVETWATSARFTRGVQIGNYVGMIPSEDSSAG